MDKLTMTCHDNGTYDINVADFTCTNPCQPPDNPEPEIMEHDWADMSINLEIGEEVIHKCKDVDGEARQFVSKAAFELGVANTFYDEIMRSCQVNGALNGTIGSYTCTRPCGPPTNYSEIFTMEWNDEGSGSGSGTADTEGSGDDDITSTEIGTTVT